MKTPFTKIVERFKVLSDLSNEESNLSDNLILGKNSLGVEYGSDIANERFSEPSPCHQALSGFLRALPNSHLFALCALMYAGRDHVADPAILNKDFTDPDQTIASLLEKTPRGDYIQTALDNFQSDMSIDDLPSKFK